MSSPKRLRRHAAALAVVAVGLLAQPEVGRASAGSPGVPRSFEPCSPSAVRAVDPLVITEDGTLQVTTTVGFSCPTGQLKLNLLFLQNGVPNGSGTGSEVPINENLRASILGMLDLVEPSSGTRAAYSAFTDAYVNQVPLTEPTAWPTRWGAWAAPGLATSGLLEALSHVASVLPANADQEGAANVVVAVLSSAEPLGSTAQIAEACAALRAVNGRLALVDMQQMRGSGGLGDLTCIDWYIRSLDGEGRDLPQTFLDLAQTVLYSPTVTSVEIADAMTDAFAYVRRSASPREPDTSFGNDVTWLFDPVPTEPFTLTYRAKAAAGWLAVRTPVSHEATATFTYSDRSILIKDLANPPVCINPHNDPTYCQRTEESNTLFLPALARGH
jgi:hypothetical protein